MNEKDAFIRQFRELQPKFSRLYVQLLAQAKLTLPQFALLSQLAVGGPVSMTQISGKLHITKPAVTNLVDRLEQQGLLKRTPHPRDRRISILRIQPRGERLVHQTQGRVLDFVLKAFHSFSASEKKVIARFYNLLSKNMDQQLLSFQKHK